jgi:hypothetical protein
MIVCHPGAAGTAESWIIFPALSPWIPGSVLRTAPG